MNEDQLYNRFVLFGALYIVCTLHHSGLSSRGYRILCALDRAGYRPGLSVGRGIPDNEEMEYLVEVLTSNYADKL